MLGYLIDPILFSLSVDLSDLALSAALHLGLDAYILLSPVLPPLLVNPSGIEKEINRLKIDSEALMFADFGVGDIGEDVIKDFLGRAFCTSDKRRWISSIKGNLRSISRRVRNYLLWMAWMQVSYMMEKSIYRNI